MGAFFMHGGEGGIAPTHHASVPCGLTLKSRVLRDLSNPLLGFSSHFPSTHKKSAQWAPFLCMAEKEGFEPSMPVTACTLSRGVVSATHPLLRGGEV